MFYAFRLRTGDYVKMDNDGYIYFKNRIKEVINFGKFFFLFSLNNIKLIVGSV